MIEEFYTLLPIQLLVVGTVCYYILEQYVTGVRHKLPLVSVLRLNHP